MKKIFLLLSFLSFLSSLGMTFAYTSTDLSNAHYLAGQGVVTQQNIATKYRLDDKVLRQEIIGMALKMKWITVPANYACKKYFSDVVQNDWVCWALELAADNSIITRENMKARPTDFVTRAEALAILLKTGKVSLSLPRRVTQPDWSVWSLYQDLQKLWFTQWQADMLDSLPNCLVINHGVSCEDGASTNTSFSHFQPNSVALRSEVFEFAAIMSGFIPGDNLGWVLDDLDILLPRTIVLPSTPSNQSDTSHLSVEMIKALFEDESIQAESTSPQVALVVFSDMECPFCTRLENEVLYPIRTDISTQTLFVYKHFPLSFHGHAYDWALESECVRKNLWSTAFFDYIHMRPMMPDLSVYKLVSGLTEAQVTACWEDTNLAQHITDDQTLWANIYTISATPTMLIINMKTHYYETIVGAQSKEFVEAVIQTVKDHK